MENITSKPYKNLIMEIRPRLQSVNIFINLNCTFTSAQIILFEHHFSLVLDGHETKIDCPNFRIIVDSLSSVRKDVCFISFRVSTNSVHKGFGSFKSEVLALDNKSNITKTSCFLNKSSSYSVKCGNCSTYFSKDLSFDRILPLPSDNSEQNDWFCHAHSENDILNLYPNLRDIFYSDCYVHLNSNLLLKISETSSILRCKRCLYWIGLVLNDSTHKIWFNTVYFETGSLTTVNSTSNSATCNSTTSNSTTGNSTPNNSTTDDSTTGNSTTSYSSARNSTTPTSNTATNFKSDPLQDAFITVKNTLEESLLTSSKIILNCQVSSTEVNYLLLWVLEKSLTIQVEDGNGLQPSEVAKVMFKYHSNDHDDVKQWKKDFGISCIGVSKDMLLSIIKHLYKMHCFIPKAFASSNGLNISYLMMYS